MLSLIFILLLTYQYSEFYFNDNLLLIYYFIDFSDRSSISNPSFNNSALRMYQQRLAALHNEYNHFKVLPIITLL